MAARRPVVLCILDGWGDRPERQNNAVALASTPNYAHLRATWPHAQLRTCGEDVGLPEGQMGNSEVGHMNLGAGRVVLQELVRIGRAIRQDELAGNPALVGLIEKLKASGGRAHVIGLLSPGGVHAHQDHEAALLRILADAGVPAVVHVVTDGRDTPPRAGKEYVERFLADIADLKGVEIGTVSGRYYAMDRDKRWERTAKAWHAIGDGEPASELDAPAAIEASYDADVADEFIVPVALPGFDGVRDGDGLLFTNFRGDRARQILSALLLPDFAGFERDRVPKLAAAVGMVEYGDALSARMDTLFPPFDLEETLGELVARAGLRQLRIAETEKYPHVTYFFNGGDEAVFEGEERILVPSPKVATYDLQPEMSAPEVTERLVEAIDGGRFDFVLINYANPDMVGHTGDLNAAIRAVETVDQGLGKLADAVERRRGCLFVTADHGNCETMVDPETGQPHTAHTLNRVPCILVGADPGTKLRDGRLADVAPTLLELLGLEQPPAMDGRSLIVAD